MRKLLLFIGEWLEQLVTLDRFELNCKQLVVSDLRGTREFIYTVPVKNKLLYRFAMYIQQGSELKDYRVRAMIKSIFRSGDLKRALRLTKQMGSLIFKCRCMTIEEYRKNDNSQIKYYSPWSDI